MTRDCDRDWLGRFLECGDLILDVEGRRLKEGDGPVQHVNPLECRLLKTFMQHPGKTLTRAFLMREVWETDFAGDTRTLEVHICWLRRKLGENADNPRHIKTVRGVGYYFDPY